MKSGSVPLATCEKDFILQCIRSRKRLDGRETYDYRKIKIEFGVERGYCEVQLGKTRVLAQVSCDVSRPKPNRPTEGQLYINVELSPMASPAFETGRMTDFGVEINRFMERFYIESRAVDLESLCIVAGEKVWAVRVDIHVLDHGGNITDCASIAAITALAHFRRPDVSVVGEEVTFHPADERDPVPLGVLHMPVSVTFAFFDDGKLLLVDPTDDEERIMNGRMMMAMNIHREVCGAVMGGGVSLETEQIIRCSKIAVVKVVEITELIQQALKEDARLRSSGAVGSVESAPKVKRITTTVSEQMEVDMTEALTTAEERNKTSPPQQQRQDHPTLLGPCTAQIGDGGENTWGLGEEEEDDEIENGEEKICSPKTNSSKRLSRPRTPDESDGEGSEEDEVVVLTPEQATGFKHSDKPKDEPAIVDLTVALKTRDDSTASEKQASKKPQKKKKKKTPTS